MTLSKRRFSAIKDAAIASLICPVITHGEAAPLVQSTEDRFAIITRAFRDIRDVMPAGFWDICHPRYPGDGMPYEKLLAKTLGDDVVEDYRRQYDQKFSEAIDIGMALFPEIPTTEETTLFLKGNEDLELTATNLMVIGSVRSVLRGNHLQPRITKMAAFDRFARVYRNSILG